MNGEFWEIIVESYHFLVGLLDFIFGSTFVDAE